MVLIAISGTYNYGVLANSPLVAGSHTHTHTHTQTHTHTHTHAHTRTHTYTHTNFCRERQFQETRQMVTKHQYIYVSKPVNPWFKKYVNIKFHTYT